jgi:hypothetical protein
MDGWMDALDALDAMEVVRSWKFESYTHVMSCSPAPLLLRGFTNALTTAIKKKKRLNL